ncbi:MAG: energy-coupling factor ABC transporter permease [Dehalococcoidia bacterium]|nr:energy-coupling factor ABC transporter permease [Dehalococcoidia bacterium]
MHIPDGFLNTPTVATTCVVSAGMVALAVREVNKKLGEKQVPLMGVTAAFIFAAQMLNFPIAGGTSGHFIGAVFAAILLGPWAATLIMTSVLLLQCFIFQDGGLLALGANILNMGIIAPFAGYYVYKGISALAGGSRGGMLTGSFAGAWVSVFLAASACAVELWVSGSSPLQVAFPAMAGWHAIIGIGEGIITVAALSLVLATRRDLVGLQKA